MPTPNHKKLNISDVCDLGRTLIDISNRYPTTYLTERDFFPLVVAYLTGRVPDFSTEVAVRHGNIDFHMKGTNPTWLELAVQPRHMHDKHNPDVEFPGHKQKNSLYPSANSSELRKLVQPSDLPDFFEPIISGKMALREKGRADEKEPIHRRADRRHAARG